MKRNAQNDQNVLAIMMPKHEHKEEKLTEAKKVELEKWKKYDGYEEVHDENQERITTRWVITEKSNENRSKKVKARLIVKGFQEDNPWQTDSPTVSKEVLKVFLSVSANENWKIKAIDITNALLQGKNIQRIFVEPPAELKKTNMIWKLKKSAYGLGDASRNWYFTIRQCLE